MFKVVGAQRPCSVGFLGHCEPKWSHIGTYVMPVNQGIIISRQSYSRWLDEADLLPTETSKMPKKWDLKCPK